jgi:hypothetical protein
MCIHTYNEVFCMSIMDTKLRSFNISNNKMYERFKQIQLERGKNASLRLNELIERDVKEADPQFKELTPIRSKDAPDIIIPNPFVLDQFHSIPKWEEYLKTITEIEANELINHLIALKLFTEGFEGYRLD